MERPWEKNLRLRQIVVQATNDKGRTIQVAILTDDLKRAAIEIIKLKGQVEAREVKSAARNALDLKLKRPLPGRPRLLPQVDSVPRSEGSAS